MKPKPKSIAVAAFGVALGISSASCGYRPVHGAGAGNPAVYVPLVQNQTSYGDVTATLTSAVRRVLSRKGLEVVGAGKPAARLELKVMRIDNTPGMTGIRSGRLIAMDDIWRIRVEAVLLAADGGLAAGPETIEVEGRVFAGGNALAEEALGRRSVQTLFDEVAYALAYRFFQR